MKQMLLLLTTFLYINDGFACDCINGGSFLNVIKKKEVVLVALIKVNKFSTFKSTFDSEEQIPISMEIELCDRYKGVEQRKRIRIWGNTGNTCRQNLTTFSGKGIWWHL